VPPAATAYSALVEVNENPVAENEKHTLGVVAFFAYEALREKLAVEATPHDRDIEQAPAGDATVPEPETDLAGSKTAKE
jgi:hypothetical protein